MTTSNFKARKGFGKVCIDGQNFQYSWATNISLILYDENDKKYTIPYETWNQIDFSDKYNYNSTWHGKHKTGPDFASWGKPEAAEMWRKFQKIKEISDHFLKKERSKESLDRDKKMIENLNEASKKSKVKIVRQNA